MIAPILTNAWKADELQVIVHKLTEEEDRAKYLTAQLAALKEEERGNVEGKEEKILVEKVCRPFERPNASVATLP